MTVLWLVLALGVLAVDDSAVTDLGVREVSNRVALNRARWRIEGCVAGIRAAIDAALADSSASPTAVWDTLDGIKALQSIAHGDGCDLVLEAAGDRVDVNSADEESLAATLAAAGAGQRSSDSIAAAIVDWRDADTSTRPLGAEADWYRARRRVAPSNAPFDDSAELKLVRGLEGSAPFADVLTTEPGRIVLDRAPLPVIAGLPGVSPEVIAAIANLRRLGERAIELRRLEGMLTENVQAELVREYVRSSARIALEPDAWIVRAIARSGDPPVSATEEVRLVRAGRRAAVVRRRLLW